MQKIIVILFGSFWSLLGLAGLDSSLLLLKSGNIDTSSPGVHLQTAGSEGLYIVQWKGLIYEKEKEELRKLGVKFYDYIPNNSFIVLVRQADALEKMAAKPFVKWVHPYTNLMKLEPELTKFGVFSFQESQQFVVETTDGANIEQLQAYFPFKLTPISKTAYVGETSTDKLLELAKRPDVLWAELYTPVEMLGISATDLWDGAIPLESPQPPPYTGYESGSKIINIQDAWNAGYRGEGMVVAVADSGLDSGNLKTLMPDFQGQVLEAYSAGFSGDSWEDVNSHGTHVSGSVVGNGASSDGNIRGSAYRSKLIMQGLWSRILKGPFIPAPKKLFKRAYESGAHIHSNSWGRATNGRYDFMARQVDEFAFENEDFLIVFAAGNGGIDSNRDGVIDDGGLFSPGTAKNIVSVGASKNYILEGGIQRKIGKLGSKKNRPWGAEPIASTTLSDNPVGMAPYSSRGPTADGRYKPDVVAPGTNIVSTCSSHKEATKGWGAYDDVYCWMGGTSMSAPIVSGALAVLRQILVENVPYVSSALLKAVLINGAYDLYPGQFGVTSRGQEQPTLRPNNHQGWGRVDMSSIINRPLVISTQKRLATGQSHTYEVKLPSNARSLRVTMVYTDAPAASSAQRALVNDLDLALVSPSGKIYYPNGLRKPDTLNNVENIDVHDLEVGEYSLVVTGFNVPSGKEGKQSYSLVYSYY